MLEKFTLTKVIAILVKKPKKYSIRELAKTASIGVASSKRCLDWLFSKNIVNLEKVGKVHQYSLNLENFLTRYIKITFSLAEISDSKIINELLKKHPSIISVVLYGSAARGEDNPESDIDLLVISNKKLKIEPLNAEDKIEKEVTIINYALLEWREKAKVDKPFYDRIITDGIALYGEIPLIT